MNQVFLGGSYGKPITWRKRIAIPILESEGVSYYNPDIENWIEGVKEAEAKAKKESKVLLFVIDNMTRSITSMNEAIEYIVAGRRIVLVVQDLKDGTTIYNRKKGHQVITGSELDDLNQGRAYVRSAAQRYNAPVCEMIEEAVQVAIKWMKTEHGIRPP